MAGRIITMQRQARELGRLRTGTYNGKRPVRSETWIVTSHSEEYVRAAAALWGGEPEKWQPQGGGAAQWRVITPLTQVDAILPPGDPLSQSYEMWSRGGCQRRCDGASEELSAGPCLCRRQFGEDFHEQPADKVCQIHTRLNVVLPDLPDLGYWRMETKSFYAANEIAGAVDLIRSATGGQAMIPIRLRIEPRKRVSQGKTKQYPVVVLEVRGATAGQIMSGARLALDGAAPAAALGAGVRPAGEIEAGPLTAEQVAAAVDECGSLDELTDLLRRAQAAGLAQPGDDLLARFVARREKIQASDAAWSELGNKLTVSNVPARPSVAEVDSDAVWQEIVAAWQGTMSDLEAVFAEHNGGLLPGDSTPGELRAFLEALHAGRVKPPEGSQAVPF